MRDPELSNFLILDSGYFLPFNTPWSQKFRNDMLSYLIILPQFELLLYNLYMSYYEHHKRSLAKTLGFHLLIVVADTIVVFLFVQKASTTLDIVVLTNLVSGLLYFVHERTWNKIHWGKTKIEIDVKDISPF